MVSCRAVFAMGRLNGNNIWHVVNWNALTRSQKSSERNSPEAGHRGEGTDMCDGSWGGRDNCVCGCI